MIGRRTKPSPTALDKPKGFDDFDLKLGDVMRGERATLGKSLLDVQRELKIKATYIAAIENADVSAFETQGFIAGYVRSYARYLQMDPEWAYSRFCAEANVNLAQTGMPGAVSAPRPAAASRLPTRGEAKDPFADPNAKFLPPKQAVFAGIQPGAVGSAVVLALLIGVLGFGAWRVLQVIQRVQVTPVDQAPSAIAALDPLANVARLPGATTPSAGQQGTIKTPSADAQNNQSSPQALDLPVLVPRDGPIASINPNSPALGDPLAMASATTDGNAVKTAAARLDPNMQGSDPALAAALAVAGVSGAAPAAPATTAAASPRVTAAVAPRVQIMAVHPAWVSVKTAGGSVLFQKILDAGQKWTVPQGSKPVFLRAGNSGAVYFLVNGKPYGPAGAPGSVTKHLDLSVASLQQAYTMADLTRHPALAKAVAVADASQTIRKK